MNKKIRESNHVRGTQILLVKEPQHLEGHLLVTSPVHSFPHSWSLGTDTGPIRGMGHKTDRPSSHGAHYNVVEPDNKEAGRFQRVMSKDRKASTEM